MVRGARARQLQGLLHRHARHLRARRARRPRGDARRAGEEFGGEARVFRQQRDLRFTPDKSPYKTRTYGVIARRARRARPVCRALRQRPLRRHRLLRLARDQLERFRAAVADDAAGPELEAAAAAAEDAGPRARRRQPAHGAPRLSARPPADRAAAPQVAHRRPRAGRATGGIARDAALEHVGRRVAGRRAAQRLARRARRAEHAPAAAARHGGADARRPRVPLRPRRARAPGCARERLGNTGCR